MTAAVDANLLLARIGQGDQAAMRALYLQFRDRVYHFIRGKVRDETLAEDVTSETFLAVWKGAHRFEGRSQAVSWIFSIAHNQMCTALRKKPECNLADMDFADDSDNAEAAIIKGDDADDLVAALSTLSRRRREAIELFYFEHCSIEGAAQRLGIPANTVKTRLFGARRALREHLSFDTARQI